MVGASARLRTPGRSRAARPPRGDRDPAPGASGRRGPGRRPLATTGRGRGRPRRATPASGKGLRSGRRRRRPHYRPARGPRWFGGTTSCGPSPSPCGGWTPAGWIALAALGDFSDLRSRWTVGRSGRVARLAATAAELCGLGADDVAVTRRAGAVADLAVGVPGGVWASPAPLDDGGRATSVAPVPTERVLGRCSGLRRVTAIAGAHHERLDGSGYFRSGRAAAARVSADSLRGRRVVRPWRGPGAPPRARHP